MTSGRYTIHVVSSEDPGKVLGYLIIKPCPVERGDVATVRDADGQLRVGKVVRAGRRLVALKSYAPGEKLGSFPVERVLGKVVEFVTAAEANLKAARGKDDTAAKIEALRDRLSELDEAHDESARFRLLREIYDLEHAPVESEEWPEYIMPEGDAA